MACLSVTTEVNLRVRSKLHYFVVVDFVVLHTLHDKSKQVGLERRMVCDAACFLISDKSTTADIATDDTRTTR